MAFRFRLQKLLEYREMQLDQMRVRLGNATEHILNCENSLQNAVEHHRQLGDLYAAPDEGFLSALRLQSRLAEVRCADALIQKFQSDLKQAELRRDEIRREVLDMNRNLKTLQRLREKKLAEHSKEISAQELKEMDDIQSRRGQKRSELSATLASK